MVREQTHDFIDDPLVGVEVEGEAGIAGNRNCTHGQNGDSQKIAWHALFLDEHTRSPLRRLCPDASHVVVVL